MLPFKRFHCLLFGLLAIWLSGCNFSLAADVTPPPGYQPPAETQAQAEATSGPLYPIIPPDPQKGQAIYLEDCAPCHGETGKGDGPRASELPNPVEPIGTAELARQASPASWFKIISQGNMDRFMPAFTSLSDRQRWDVVAYLYELSSVSGSLAEGATIYQENCVRCHGASGVGNGVDATGIMPDFSNQESMANKTASEFFQTISNGEGPNMPGFAGALSEEDRWSLTEFLRSLTFESSTVAHAAPPTSIPGQETNTPVTIPVTTTTMVTVTEGSGVVQGTITNPSGGSELDGLAVNLHAFDGMSLVYTATVQTQVDGSYRFEGVRVQKSWTFLTTVDYHGALYGSQLTTAEQDNGTVELPIQVYDTTTDASVLSVDRLHFFFEFLDQNTVRVVELYVISNPTEKTVIGSSKGEPVTRFTLPESAANLQFQEGELGGRYIKTDNGFGDTVSIQPGAGNYQLLFSYEMPYQRKLELTRPVTMNIQALVVLVPEGSVKVKGEGLQDSGTRDVQGVQYHMYNGNGLKAGSEIHLTVTGSPAGEGAELLPGQNTNLIVGLGALGLVLILAGGWMYLRNRFAQQVREPVFQAVVNPDERPENIMDAILALDDMYKDGKLPENAYIERRTELKGRLKESMESKG